jgi:uncharacterized tellurite resistance protein B-like protein
MTEEFSKPRFEGDTLIIETRGAEEVYDAKYLVSSLLVFVAKGDGKISEPETAEMIQLVSEHFGLPSSQSLELLTNAMEDIESLLRDLSRLLSVEEKEEVALMMLRVVAANGRKDAEEMGQLRRAAEIIDIPPETLHRAFDRYFEETIS